MPDPRLAADRDSSFTPSDVTPEMVKGRFGLFEFEKAITLLIEYLRDDSRMLTLDPPDEPGMGWEKKFRLSTVEGIDPALFAMLCACGWIRCVWHPKYTFIVSDALIERLKSR